MYVCNRTFVKEVELDFKNTNSHLRKRDGEVEQKPEVDHLHVRGLWEGIRHTDEPWQKE